MAGFISFVVIVIILVVLAFYLRKHNLLPSWLSNLWSPNSDKLVIQLKLRAEKELLKSKELQDVLEAKKTLMQIKARNNTLQRNISAINESNVSLMSKKPIGFPTEEK